MDFVIVFVLRLFLFVCPSLVDWICGLVFHLRFQLSFPAVLLHVGRMLFVSETMDSLTVSVILVTKAMATGAQVCCYVLST